MMVNNYRVNLHIIQLKSNVKNKVIALNKNINNNKKNKINQLGQKIYACQTQMGVNTSRAVMMAGEETSCWEDVRRK